MDEARVAAGADGRRRPWWSDDNGGLVGWVALDGRRRTVGEHLREVRAEVPLGTTLRAGPGQMLQHDVRWIPVVENERYLGVLTPNRLHAAMRRSVGGTPVES